MISVIVPVYNAERYVGRCVASILGQTFRDLEVLLIDDGSADDSGLICYAHALRDSRVVYVRAANAGEGAARNRGLALARGDLVAFADNDDWLEPGMYAAMAAAMADGIDLVMCNATVHGRRGDTLMTPAGTGPFALSGRRWLRMTLARDGPLSPSSLHPNWNKLYRRRAIGSARFMEDVRIGGDVAFNVEVLTRCREAAYLPAPLYHYRHTGNGFSMSRFTAEHLTEFLIYPRLREMLAADPEMADLVRTEEARAIVGAMGMASHDPEDPGQVLCARDLTMFVALHRLAAGCPGFLGRLTDVQREVYFHLRDLYMRKD